MDAEDILPWLTLHHMPGLTPLLFNRLLKQFKSPQHILTCDLSAPFAQDLRPELRAALKRFQTLMVNTKIKEKVEQSVQWLRKNEKHHIICQESKYYPSLLLELIDSPPLLYVVGDPEKLTMPQLAMVGSRNPGPSGRKNARRFAREISQAGFLICSGMALGIDYESHMGALEADAATLAVLGTGIDQVYPDQHRDLAKKIIANGALISEFPLGTKARPWHFPQRNRIISGMSQGTLVVEAAMRSGSLITARLALEQGREVFAIPGSIYSATAKGCHSLIKQGAKLVEKIDDVLEELGAFVVLAKEQERVEASVSLSKEEKLVLAELDYEPINIDRLVLNSGLEITQLSVALMKLEIKGLIQSVAGGYTVAIP